MIPIIDTHCHLDFPQFDDDRDEVLARAGEAAVSDIIHIEIDPGRWKHNDPQQGKSPKIWRTAGLHPNSVASEWGDDVLEHLRSSIESGGFIGVGESGIDLFRSSDSLEIQRSAFEAHIRLAQDLDLPLVIHQREAEEEVLGVLRRAGPVRGVMHCFGGDWGYASACIELGLHLGIGGVSTYPSAAGTREALKRAPRNRLLLETDAPFLAPQPVRGKRNESAYLGYVVGTIAETRGEHEDEVRRYTTRNAIELFGLGS